MGREIPNWDDYFMSMVYLAASRSKDHKTHIGAVVVGQNKEVVSLGYNGFPRGVNDFANERQEKPIKFEWLEHGERNAIYNATLIGASLKGCSMYTNGVPCTHCARGIIQSGIREVIVDEEWDKTNSIEDKENSEISLQMFNEAGVKVRYWNGKLLNVGKYRRWKFTTENDKMAQLKIKKINPEAIIPKYSHEGDAGMDLFSCEDYNLKPGERKLFAIGFQVEVPEGYEMQVRPRSGMALKHGITVLNTPGTIDAGYRGEVGVILFNSSPEEYPIKKGDRIAQAVINKFESADIVESEDLSETSRGEGGFGSTGKNGYKLL